MKQVKRALGFVLAGLFLVLMLPVTAAAASADDSLRYGRTVLGKMARAETLLYVYEQLAEGCADAAQTITVEHATHSITADELSTVFRVFHSDYPEYFWVTGGYRYSYNSGSGHIIAVLPEYAVTGSQLKTAKEALENKVKEMVKGLDGKSEYEKARLLHDRMAEAVTYTHASNDQNAYGALVEGKAVCAGYARAYQLLLHRVGMPAWSVVGTSINPATNNPEGHEWNLVSIDGKWYYTDVTWDDQEEDLFYAYFNMTTARMEEGHTVSYFKEYLPMATATEANYFVKNGLCYDRFDADALAQALKAGNNLARLFVTGNIETFRSELAANMAAVIKQMGAPAGSGYSYSLSTLGREMILSVNIIEPSHRHELTAVAQKAASCTAEGNTAYYTCGCGKWFEDAAAAKEITDKTAVVLAAQSHTPSGWKSDATAHWKICTKCQAEIADSHVAHSDGNKDHTCDICQAALPSTDNKDGSDVVVVGNGGNSGGGGTTAGQAGAGQTTTADERVQEPSGTANASQSDSSSTAAQEGQSTTAEMDPSTPATTTLGDAGAAGDGTTAPSGMVWILVGIGVAVVAAAAAGIVVFLKRKK